MSKFAIPPTPIFGLVDGNNFYASCERVFTPSLRGQPVCMLSNNDGCAIARSKECKNLGVKIGQPIHEVPSHIRRQLRIFSANFGLYGDLSSRGVSVLREWFPRVEVYSIDESFVTFDGVPAEQCEAMARQARAQILQWVGIPCWVGIGPTKTLAKLANKLAKKTPHGVVTALPGSPELETYPVEDVWGVGRKLTAKLGAEGIFTAADLARADPDKAMWKTGYRYKKAGVGLLDLTHDDVHQGDLFAGIDPRSQALMKVMDQANAKFGRGTMGMASSAWRPKGPALAKPVWALNQKNLSPAYTTGEIS